MVDGAEKPPEGAQRPAAGEDKPAVEATPLRHASPEEPSGRIAHRRIPYAHALRRLRPSRRVVRAVAGRTWAWSRRPGGRVAVLAIVLFALVATAGAAGVYLVPAMAKRNPAAVASPGASETPTGLPSLSEPPTITPTVDPSLGPTGVPPAPVGRPADVLVEWADQMSRRVEVPPIAVQAYGYAELVLAQTTPTCQLKWTTLAAIGKVESNHGRANSASLLADGRALPPIIGLPLDGQGGRAAIRDTDRGAMDGDPTWDRAVGPMQFIPSTWNSHSIDADNDGMRDANDIDDAALAAANYLCRGGRNMTVIGDWWAAILTYNAVTPYARAVYDAANDYGTRSRT